MRRVIFWLVPLLALAPSVWGDDKPKDKQPAETPAAKEWKALQNDIEQMQKQAIKTFQEAKTDEEKAKIRSTFPEKMKAFAPRFLALVQKHPDDEIAMTAVEALTQIAGDDAQKLLRDALAKSSDEQAAAPLKLGLGLIAKTKADAATGAEADKLNQEAEQLLTAVVKSRNKAALEAAEKTLFVLQNLSLGKKAPDMEGEDADGKKFKLSDYHGKVILLDFWAGW